MSMLPLYANKSRYHNQEDSWPNHEKFLLPHSAPSWILTLAENLASFSLQDRATEWHYDLTWTPHPPTAKLFLSKLCGVPIPIVPPVDKECGVSPCPPLPVLVFPHQNCKACAVYGFPVQVSPNCRSLPMTNSVMSCILKAKLRIRQASGCKIKHQIDFFKLLGPNWIKM